ncbi:polysaccharide pyruvyl transferase family protein [Rhodococcus pyridinivorans]|uniref:polysaccharide pyruvyl transferase family protein n=1 Tax=Rhodococcus pyridinivorans TaxID=103816 RepID=UPI00200B2E01|nr:polysaccharide pyruvyl transferase family protein [Rhodococcus pyridinivorans]UPW06024.1 polysaccharide pyruvyl transferase family protein [Rhodococcus pyridinivorans]
MSSRRKNILITGGNFTNQGAYLMLCAAAEQVRAQFQAQPVIALQTGTERAKRWVGVDSLFSFPRFGVRVWGGSPHRFEKIRHRLPFVVGSEIDAVLDVSGFVFSDEWAHLDLRKRADDLLWWESRGVPTVLMPQAFGPFENPEVVNPTADLLDRCAMVVARDPDSERFLKGIARNGDAARKIDISTDFTTIVSPEHPGRHAQFEGRVPIVPNWNIARRAADRGGSEARYLANLVSIVQVVRNAGYEPYGLCHEGGKDADILHQLAERVPGFEVVGGLNGRQSKWLLGEAPFVVSGRFHALVSALSQGVPAYAHGWSHKYRWLAEEYKSTDMILDPYGDPDEIRESLADIGGIVDAHRDALGAIVSVKKAETYNLWRNVGSAIAIA